MTEETEVIEEEITETSTETDDAEISAEVAAPEETTEDSDADSEEAVEAEDPAAIRAELEAARKKLAKTSYEQREAKRQNERLLAVLEQQTKDRSEPQAPKVEDFETLDDYVNAKIEYALKPSQASKAPEGPDAGFAQNIQELKMEGSSKYEDFDEKVSSELVRITPDMAATIFEIEDMDMQVELTYALANNPKEAYRISNLPPRRQATEIGKLEAKLSAPKTVKRQPSKAPAPIKPVGGSKTTSDEIGDVEDPEVFMRKWAKLRGR